MNKTELVAALAEKTQLPKKNAELALNAVVCTKTEICRHFWYSQTEKNKVR